MGEAIYKIDVTFERLSDVTVDRLFGARGVYVLWSPRSQVRPSYIGEGVLLDRLSSHTGRYGLDLEGTVGIVGYGTASTIKSECEIVEALLLEVAENVDRSPPNNKNIGKHARVRRVASNHRIVRVNISGMDPLRDPRNRPLAQTKRIQVQNYGEDIVYSWNRRSVPIQ